MRVFVGDGYQCTISTPTNYLGETMVYVTDINKIHGEFYELPDETFTVMAHILENIFESNASKRVYLHMDWYLNKAYGRVNNKHNAYIIAVIELPQYDDEVIHDVDEVIFVLGPWDIRIGDNLYPVENSASDEMTIIPTNFCFKTFTVVDEHRNNMFYYASMYTTRAPKILAAANAIAEAFAPMKPHSEVRVYRP